MVENKCKLPLSYLKCMLSETSQSCGHHRVDPIARLYIKSGITNTYKLILMRNNKM